MSIKLKDIIQKREIVEILDMNEHEKENKIVIVLKCKSEDNIIFDLGFYGKNIAEEFLNLHGSIKNDKNLLEIPTSKIRKDGISWLKSV